MNSQIKLQEMQTSQKTNIFRHLSKWVHTKTWNSLKHAESSQNHLKLPTTFQNSTETCQKIIPNNTKSLAASVRSDLVSIFTNAPI